MGNCCDNEVDINIAPPPRPIMRRLPNSGHSSKASSARGSPTNSSNPSSRNLVIENICATQRKFCLQQPVTLHVQEKTHSWSGDDFLVVDANSGVMYFECDGKANLSQTKYLLDNLGHAVVTMKNVMWTFRDAFVLYRGGTTDREICRFETNSEWMGAANISADFSDVISGKRRRVKLTGDWRNKVCSISLGDPAAGGIPIGRVYRPTTTRTFWTGQHDYLLEIAAGIDIALLVMMCIALDEHKNDRRR